MKKLLGSMLALAMFLPAGASAELLKNLKLSGRVDLQGTSARNVVDFQTKGQTGDAENGQDRVGDMQTRIMVSADWDLLDDVHSRVTLTKNDRVWGNGSQRVTDGGANTGVLNNLRVDEAFIKIDKLFGHMDTTLGRQFIGEEGDLIAYYGPKTGLYGMSVDALDAAKFDMGGENVTLSVFSGKATANTAALGIAASGHQDVRAIILGSKGNENVSGKVYLWNRVTRLSNGPVGTPPNEVNAGAVNGNLYIAGLKAKVSAGPAWLKAELAKNFGTHRVTDTPTQAGVSKYSGWAALLNAGAKVEMEGLGMVTGWGEFGYGTGNQNTRTNKRNGFESINTDYRPGALYGRFAQSGDLNFAGDVAGSPSGSNGLSNRIVKGLGVKFTPASVNKLTASLSAWDFWFQHSGGKTSDPNAQPAIGGNGNRHIGNEYDLELAWQHSENVLVKLGAASFQPGGYLRESQKLASPPLTGTRGNSPAHMFTSDVSIKF